MKRRAHTLKKKYYFIFILLVLLVSIFSYLRPINYFANVENLEIIHLWQSFVPERYLIVEERLSDFSDDLLPLLQNHEYIRRPNNRIGSFDLIGIFFWSDDEQVEIHVDRGMGWVRMMRTQNQRSTFWVREPDVFIREFDKLISRFQ